MSASASVPRSSSMAVNDETGLGRAAPRGAPPVTWSPRPRYSTCSPVPPRLHSPGHRWGRADSTVASENPYRRSRQPRMERLGIMPLHRVPEDRHDDRLRRGVPRGRRSGLFVPVSPPQTLARDRSGVRRRAMHRHGSVSVHVRDGEAPRVLPHAVDRPGQASTATPQQRGHRVAVVVGGHEVRRTVGIEVAGHHAEGIRPCLILGLWPEASCLPTVQT